MMWNIQKRIPRNRRAFKKWRKATDHQKKEIINDEQTSDSDKIRYCSICGKMLERGFTNGDMWICTEREFILYMDSVYGEGRWRPSTEKEIHDYDCLYMYYDTISEELRPVDWYYTEL